MATSQFLVTQGGTLTIAGTLKTYQGTAITNVYDGSERIIAKVWAGGPTPTLADLATAWDDPAAGTVLATISAEQTASLYAGDYQGVCRVDDGTTSPDAFYFLLSVANGPDGIGGPPASSSITRLAVEAELVDRDSALLLFAGKGTIADGKNRFLSGPIGFGLQCMGITPASPGTVTDADLANLPASEFYLLCDLAEYRLLKSLLTNVAQPDQTNGNTKAQIDTMMKRFHQQMLDIYNQYRAYLGNDEATLKVGSIRLRPPAPRYYGFGFSSSYGDF
jgi:hypothetical protein